MTEPTDLQREALAATKGRVALLTFLAPRPGVEPAEVLTRPPEVGVRRLTLRIDQVLAGPELPYRTATWDEFPNGAAALRAWDTAAPHRSASVAQAHCWTVRPVRIAPILTRQLARLSWLFRRLAPIEEGRALDAERLFGPPHIFSTAAQFDELLRGDRSRPFLNLNLSRFVGGPARRPEVVERVYNPSSLKLFGAGGSVGAAGPILGTFVGSEDDPLFDHWDEVALAAWPSRRAFRDYMANVSDDVIAGRRELMERAMQVVCSIAPE